jgi:anti-sigma regulatory factor (Ser/Thr protein kinase)
MNQAIIPGAWFRQLELTALPSAMSWARGMLRQMLCEWQLERMSDTVLLLMSELVTNAVKASGDGTCGGHLSRQMIALTVRRTDASLLMEVWDANPAPPVPREADVTRECGRGLLVVETLSDNWGHHAEGDGKVVWCEVAVPLPS